MKLKILVTPILMVSLLSSCGKKEIRSDIKDFVASFSLSESVSEYKSAGYTSTKTSFIDGVKTVETTTLNFDIIDIENPTYLYQVSTKVDDKDEEIYKKEVSKIEDKFYLLETGKDPYPFTERNIKLLVQDFFFLEVLYEGSYHCKGMYYGDYILENVYELQGFVEIDQENELYKFNLETSGKVDGLDSKVEQHYSVNKLGMLVENYSHQIKGENYIIQEITVFKR